MAATITGTLAPTVVSADATRTAADVVTVPHAAVANFDPHAHAPATLNTAYASGGIMFLGSLRHLTFHNSLPTPVAAPAPDPSPALAPPEYPPGSVLLTTVSTMAMQACHHCKSF